MLGRKESRWQLLSTQSANYTQAAHHVAYIDPCLSKKGFEMGQINAQNQLQSSGRKAPLKPRRAPSKKMTWLKLLDLIKEGRGQGHLAQFDPWLQVTSKVSSPVSNIGRVPAPDIERCHHYLAVAERRAILLLKWIGAFDVREQFPIWPWDHRHPLEGLPSAGPLEKMPGLLTIAKECGIPHGVFFGTAVPYIATIDILSTWAQPDGSFKLLATECKPAELLVAGKDSKRRHERLQLTGHYCKLANIPRKIFHAERLPKELPVNLDVLFPLMSRAAVEQTRQTDSYKWMLDAMCQHGYANRPHEIARVVASKIGASFDEVIKLLHLALWTQDIDHNLSLHLELYRPFIRGGRELRERFKEEMWRETL